MSIEGIRDESVRKLAETLRSSGMASSDSEAVRMAEEMTSTAGKVQEGYDKADEPKPSENEGTTTISEETLSSIQKVEPTYDKEDSELTPTNAGTIDAKSIYEQQKEVLNSSFGSSDDSNEVMDEDARKVYSESDTSVESVASIEEAGTVENPIVDSPSFENEESSVSRDDISVSEPSSEPIQQQTSQAEPEQQAEMFSDDDFEVESTQEIKSEQKSDSEREEEKSKMAESKVDLSDVFNFGSK